MRGKESNFADYLREIMMPALKDRQISLVVFSMPNINLIEKTVYGSLISEESVATLKTELPSLIFNFAVQHTRSDVRKLRDLMEVENLILINSANSFNQWSVMNMLSSGSKTMRFVMPNMDIAEENIDFDFAKFKNFIVKPQNGSSLSKIVYAQKAYSGYDLYNWGGIIHSHVFDIQNAIFPSIKKGNWILLVSPELITSNDRLLIIRSYLQKNNDGLWNIVLKTEIAQTDRSYKKPDEKVDHSLLQMMSYINCFVPDLHFCTIDLVIDRDGKPYFLNLGGWQNLIPGKAQHKILFNALCQNMMACAETFLN